MMTPWSSLSEGVQELVLAQLLPRDLTRVRSVCHEWKSATESPTFRDVYRRIHSPLKPSLLLYNHTVKISGLLPDATWQDMPVPGAYVRQWAGSGGIICTRSHQDNYSVGCPFSNTWRNLPAPPRPPSPATLTKLWGVVTVADRFWVVLLHRTGASLSLSLFDSETNKWTSSNSGGHLLSSYSDTAHTVGSVIYSIQPESRSVVSFDVQRNRWTKVGGDNFLPSDLGFEIKQHVDNNKIVLDTAPAVAEGHRGKLYILGASTETGLGKVWELDRVAMEWRVVCHTPPGIWNEMIEEAAECRKGDLLPVRISGHGELVVIMAAGAQRAIQYDVIKGTWSWLELPPSVNCDLSLCFQPQPKTNSLH